MTTTNMSDPLVGCVLDGRYQVLQRLARGGMATVYRALDTRLDRIVAVKVMHEGLGDDRDFARKFDREARAAARLCHPNVVSVFDQGHDHDRPYIVMEFVAGCTMRRVISRDAPLPPQRCLELIDHVLSALSAAHENNLVHRDIKPENILLSDRGQLKVADFGLARAITAQTATATQGMLIGTVSYLPPELVLHGKADTRSDVYSTGVVLFEMLTGSKPHTGETPIQVAYAHVHNEIPSPSTRVHTSWRTSRDGIPPYVDALVRAATQREPDRRPRDARQLQQMVRRALKALSAGVMNDQLLTAEFSRSYADLENTEPLDWGTPVSPTVIEPAEPPAPKNALHASERVPVGPATSGRSGVTASSISAGGVNVDSPSMLDAYETFDVPDREPVAALPLPTDEDGEVSEDDGSIEDGGYAGSERVAQRPVRRRGALVALVLLVLAGVVGGGGWWLLDGRYVAAPTIAGQPQAVAAQAVSAAGLQLTTEQAYSETVPAGQVMSTDPVAGADVVRGGELHAVISRGPERFDMPKVTGMGRQEATSALTAANLSVGKVGEEWDEQAPAGQVTSASVEPGTKLKRGDKVDLVISKGPKPIPITNYSRRSASDAQDKLESAGFTVEVRTENSKTVPAGQVISQSPGSGTGRKGDKITLVRSLGPVMVAVPEVKAMSVADATAAMQKAGFTVQSKPSDTYLGLGFVASTDPGAGAKAPEGSTITLLLV
ncbi:Stk1 family PASTA domain-containing Ser/Thr kinase [Enemella evansiae]|uniref:Stk1 family PASTA domain-containing Ser/Thr kinase n=1 Tax=Enemella evansiae TaxID=2016499 RepID=UPI00117FE410|nr:PASTA domain-containing protein [Enemella evansiae]